MAVKQIDVYNVEFGDCSLLKLDKCNLLVDCGGSIQRIQQNKIKNDILKSSQGFPLGCVVTHFHSDHYNILSLFPQNTFDAIYAPNFFTKDEIKIQLYALLLLSSTSSTYLMAKTMLESIPKLVDSGIIKKNAWVQFVKKGDYISDKNIEVLWPDIDYQKGSEIIDKFEELANDAIKAAIQNSSTHNEASDLIGLTETIDSYASQYSELLEGSEVTGQTLYQAAEPINFIIGKVLDIKSQLNRILGKISGLPTKSVKKIQNQYSIVFHEYKNPCDIPLLYLGDVSADVYDKHIKKIVCKNEYKYIKIAHHGTKNYFMKDLPISKIMIISNGKRKKPDISAMYPLYYSNQKFVCTNNVNCEYYKAKTHFGKKNISLPCQHICNFNSIKETLL